MRHCDGSGRVIDDSLSFALAEKTSACPGCPNCQPKDTHLSGDGERLEEIAKWLRRKAGQFETDASGPTPLVTQMRRNASTLEDLATRLSPENSSGVEEGLREAVEEIRADLWERSVQGTPMREVAERLLTALMAGCTCSQDFVPDDCPIHGRCSTQPVSPQPDPTTRLSEGSDDA